MRIIKITALFFRLVLKKVIESVILFYRIISNLSGEFIVNFKIHKESLIFSLSNTAYNNNNIWITSIAPIFKSPQGRCIYITQYLTIIQKGVDRILCFLVVPEMEL